MKKTSSATNLRSVPSNLPGHSEERCSSSRQAWRNFSVSAFIDATIACGEVFSRFAGRIAVHRETEIRFLCSESELSADRETSPLFPPTVSESKMPLCGSLVTRYSRELLALKLAIREQPVAFLFGMRSTSERDWFRVSHALQAIEPLLVCQEHRPQ